MENGLGKLVMYSLASDLALDWDRVFEEAQKTGLDEELIPTPVKRNKDKNIIEIKEMRRNIVKAVTRYNGVLLRASGGVFFIPQAYVRAWNTYENTFREKFQGVDITPIDVANTTDNKREIIRALLNEIRSDYKQEIYRLSKKKPDGGNLKELVGKFLSLSGTVRIKTDATNNMYDRLDGMSAKVSSYEQYLNADLKYLREQTDRALNTFSEQHAGW